MCFSVVAAEVIPREKRNPGRSWTSEGWKQPPEGSVACQPPVLLDAPLQAYPLSAAIVFKDKRGWVLCPRPRSCELPAHLGSGS